MALNEKLVRELLDQSTPGPWNYELEGGCVMDDLVEVLNGWVQNNNGELVFGTGLELSDEQEIKDLALAALAPELARDWLRMRDELENFRNLEDGGSIDWESFSKAEREAAKSTRD